jgi:K+-sensing histidine kinase KdpD
MLRKFSQPISTLAGVALLACCALLTALFFAGRPTGPVVPLAFVILIVAVSVRFGALVGIAGSVIGAAIFAHYLFPPVGSLRVEGEVARANIGWMLLAGISLSYLFAGAGVSDKHHKHHK